MDNPESGLDLASCRQESVIWMAGWFVRSYLPCSDPSSSSSLLLPVSLITDGHGGQGSLSNAGRLLAAALQMEVCPLHAAWEVR